MGFKWDVTPTAAMDDLVENYTKVLFTSGRRVAEKRAAEMGQWAQANAPWQDRTGAARRGLHAAVAQSPGVIAQITLSHDPSLDYPIWLEIANGGKYAIIAPAVDMFAPLFMRDLASMENLGLIAR